VYKRVHEHFEANFNAVLSSAAICEQALKSQSKVSTQTQRKISIMTLIPEQIQALTRLIQDSTDLKERLQRATSIDDAASLLSQTASNAGLAIEASSIRCWIEEQSRSVDTLNDNQQAFLQTHSRESEMLADEQLGMAGGTFSLLFRYLLPQPKRDSRSGYSSDG
jgi:hypothetical protein